MASQRIPYATVTMAPCAEGLVSYRMPLHVSTKSKTSENSVSVEFCRTRMGSENQLVFLYWAHSYGKSTHYAFTESLGGVNG